MTDACKQLANKFWNFDTQTGYVANINVYDIYRTCWTNPTLHEDDHYGYAEVDGEVRKYKRLFSTKDYTPWLHDGKHRHPILQQGDCTWDSPLTDFANKEETRKALNIPSVVPKYEECNDRSNFSYDSGHKASYWIYPILKGRYRILHYSGDTDGAVPTYGTQRWMHELNWPITHQYRYIYRKGQVVGSYTQREGLDFGTIHGCGHMAPQWKRPETYHLIFNWVFGKEI